MAITIHTQPTATCFSSMLGDIYLTTDSTATGTRIEATVTLGSTTLLKETYTPVDGAVTIRDLTRLVTPYLQTVLTDTLTATIKEVIYDTGQGTVVYDTETVTSDVYLCDAELDALPSAFFAARFATMLSEPKRTTLARKESIWYYSANGGETPQVVGQYWDGADISIQTHTLTAQSGAGYHEVDASAANYTVSGKRLLRYYVQVGSRRQTFVIDHTEQEGSPALAFRNAFGLWECIHCHGTEKTVRDYERLSATVLGALRNYRIDETVTYHADTAPLTPMEQVWATDLFRSLDVWMLRNGVRWKEVVITDSQVETDDSDDALVRYTFTYRLSQRNHHLGSLPAVTSIFDATFDDTFN